MKKFFTQTTGIGLILFVILSIYNVVLDIKEDIEYIEKTEIIKTQVAQIEHNSAIVLELQRERGLTSIYFANTSKEHYKKVLLQRVQSDKQFTKEFHTLKESLNKIRSMTDKKSEDRVFVFNSYSELIRNLFLDTKSLTFNTSDKVLKNELSIYNDLNALQEIMGKLRAKVGVALSSNKIDKKEIYRLHTLFYNQLETTFYNDILSSGKYTRKISKAKCLKKALKISKNLEKELLKPQNKLSALEWFSISTCAIDKVSFYVNKQLEIINKNIEKNIEIAKAKRIKNFLIWLFGLFVLSVFVYISLKKSRELLKEQAMLRNYKRAIDYSSMVTTTTKGGVITHVNETLCKASGYTKEEFLGKEFDMTFSKDTSKTLLADMQRHTLKNRMYNTIIRHTTKKGDSFWTDSFIIPILDDKENLVEFITIAYDITETLHLNEEILETQRELIYRLGEAVESRNKESGNHIKRVAHFSRLLAQLSNLSKEECDTIFAASSMHDVGKIAIPDSILLKPAKLDDEEWVIMKTHTDIGYKLFKDSKRPLLKAAADIAHEHHEFYNGKGYPRGLKGDEISIFGRIVAITDVFDALSSTRPYKEPWKLEDILALLKKESGSQFDPSLIDLFLKHIDEFIEIRDKFVDE